MKSDKNNYYQKKYSETVLSPSPYFTKQFNYIKNYYFINNNLKISILDLGGGTGEYSLILQNAGYNVTLFDFSQEAIDKAIKIGVKNTICADFNTFDFSKHKFDIILAKGFSLLNTDNPEEFRSVLNKSKPLLTKSGIFIYWGQTDLSHKWTKSGWYQLSNNELKQYFTHTLVLPAFRYQLNFPHPINIIASKFLLLFKKLPKSISLIGILND